MSSILIPQSTIDSLKALAQKVIRTKYLRVYPYESKMWHTSGTLSGDIGSNCLPAHLAIIDKVIELKLGPNPAVVIGKLLDVDAEITTKQIAEIKDKSGSGPKPHSGYHAWIVLDVEDSDSDIIDITGHHFKGITVQEHYMNNAIAARESLKHHAVLTDLDSVYSYHANLVKTQIATGTTTNQRIGLISYLRKFAQMQGVSEDLALGKVGREAVALELGQSNTQSPTSIFDKITNYLRSKTK